MNKSLKSKRNVKVTLNVNYFSYFDFESELFLFFKQVLIS